MSTFCDVALPVPLDMAFTYKIAEQQPVVGGRVLVPFRNQRISGVVTALHDRAPSMQAKTVLEVLDTEPVLGPEAEGPSFPPPWYDRGRPLAAYPYPGPRGPMRPW